MEQASGPIERLQAAVQLAELNHSVPIVVIGLADARHILDELERLRADEVWRTY